MLWNKPWLRRAQNQHLVRLGLTAIACFALGYWSSRATEPVHSAGMQLVATASGTEPAPLLSRNGSHLSGHDGAASRRGPSFENFRVEKAAGDSLFVVIPSEEALYADGNHAQEALYTRIYKEACDKPGNLVVDIGGLLGDFAMAAGMAGCSAICFEPQRPYYDLIRANVLLNGLEGAIEVIHAAAGPEHDAKLYYVRGDHAGGSHFALEPPPGGVTEEVPSYRLDRYLDPKSGQSVLLIKIDVEGFDVGVVHSAEGLIRANLLKHLIFEYTPYRNDQGQWTEVLDWLHSLPSPPRLYALHRMGTECYGPLDPKDTALFKSHHEERKLQTDIYATWDKDFDPKCSGPWMTGIWARRRHLA